MLEFQMSIVSRTPGRRFLKLAGMTASIAGKALSHSIKSINSSEAEKTASRSELYGEIGAKLADTLGQMKGAAMKVGQVASQYKDLFPPEIAAALAKLQRQAPVVAFATMRQQIERELGKPLDQIFKSFDEKSFASASIGQVYRAVLHDGQNVVVKVQYPGVDESCDSDLKQLRMALKLTGVLKVDKKTQDALFHEIQQSLHGELNYLQEAHNLNVFAAFHNLRDQKLIIPKVYPEYSSRRVLTLSEELGDTIDTAALYSDTIRSEIGVRLFQAIADQIFVLNSFHCDPHPGNFAFRPDGSVVMYDFGGIKELDQAVLKSMKKLVNAALVENIPLVEQALRELQVRNFHGQIPADFYIDWKNLLSTPLIQPFNFATSNIHLQTSKMVKKSMQYWESFGPSAALLMVNRTMNGHYWNMVHLNVHSNFKTLTERYIKE
jgi:predicted unusual protein kinase regulating ubiquinone biosynthesis (AarF/ABC1/UbiB family)